LSRILSKFDNICNNLKNLLSTFIKFKWLLIKNLQFIFIRILIGRLIRTRIALPIINIRFKHCFKKKIFLIIKLNSNKNKILTQTINIIQVRIINILNYIRLLIFLFLNFNNANKIIKFFPTDSVYLIILQTFH